MPEITNQPFPISQEEWQEIMQVPEVREAWGLHDKTTIEEFTDSVYGVKFKFVSGSPGYVGDLYLLLGFVLTGDPPFMLGRQKGKLFVF